MVEFISDSHLTGSWVYGFRLMMRRAGWASGLENCQSMAGDVDRK